MSEPALRDRIDERQRLEDNGKVMKFCELLEELGRQRARRRKGAAWISDEMRATMGGPQGERHNHPSAERLVHNKFLPSL